MLTWYKDAFNNEVGEFERVIDELTANRTDDSDWDGMFNKLEKSYKSSAITTLTNNVWAKVKNTDSWEATTIQFINKAIKENSKGSETRNIYNVLREVLGSRARCPIILQYKGSYTLIGGNTRLMACRLIGIVPKVIFVKG